MRQISLLLLRLSIGTLLLVWGADKLVNPAHGMDVARHFYAGLFGGAGWMPLLGGAQIALGALCIIGVARRYVYPVVGAVTGVTLAGVWKSVVDPWGWYLEGTNALFYPSIIIFAGVVVLWAFRPEDGYALDARLAAAGGPRRRPEQGP